ncbi:MAG: S1 family peptidase [Gemmatimonadetes bacterium]|nr:S1 family peptidase [Gemmatimonadota bacterium]
MSARRRSAAPRKQRAAARADGMNASNLAVLDAAAVAGARDAQAAAAEELLAPGQVRANVKGVGLGVKWTDGRPTGEPALIVLVNQKLPREALRKADMVPARLEGIQTDVLAIGEPFAGGEDPAEADIHSLARRIRPAEGGYSVGHLRITAGTIATCVYDFLPGARVSPPVHGTGIPPRFYILSNNHVLANTNAASLGDPVLQPGPFDGGNDPADRIARLARFIPIVLDPPVPRPQHNNLVDAAIAEGQFHDLDREIYWNGYVRGWHPRASVRVGAIVKKTGRTTNFTTGRITTVNATVDVGYGGGRVGRFVDQIVTTNMSAGGDSGSLVLTLDNVAVGLLFAGSSVATIVNQIEHVRALLRIEVAEQVI